MEFFTDDDKELRKKHEKLEKAGLPAAFIHTETISTGLLEILRESFRKGDEEVSGEVSVKPADLLKAFNIQFTDEHPLTEENYTNWAELIEEKAREISGFGETLTVKYVYEEIDMPGSTAGPSSYGPFTAVSRHFRVELASE